MLVITPVPLPPGVVVPCRALGILKMEDEGGVDGKVIAVPTARSCRCTPRSRSLDDLPEIQLAQIKHFFEHCKDLDAGKWVKVLGWEGKRTPPTRKSPTALPPTTRRRPDPAGGRCFRPPL